MTERRSFFAELKRRNVYKVAVAYAIVGWLIVQIATQVFPFLEIPNWVVRLVIILVATGFPMALIIAWAFELTPEGIKRTGDVDRSAQDTSTNRIWVYVAVIGAALAVGLFFVGRYTAGNRTPGHNASPAPTEATTAIAQKSIAVLPLLNESGDPKDEYFSDGLSEELIAALAQIRDLKVIGRSSSFRFKDRKEEPKTIGEKLGVATLLEGTVRKQGDRVRIVAELVHASDGIELWTRTFDRELKDIFAVQSEIAAAVADSLKVTLLGDGKTSPQQAATSNVEAHNAYLQAHFYFARRNLDDYRKAVGFYNQAIELDPNYALAYAERSEAWTFIGDLDSQQKKQAWSAAKADAEKAVQLGPNLAESHAALGWVRAFVEWKFPDGVAELRRAKELAPANPTANDLLARVLAYVGQMQEAEAQARRAIELDPLLYLARNNLARILFLDGRLDEAELEARKAAEVQPAAASSHRWQTLVAVQRGDGEAALREAQLEPDGAYRHYLLALAHYTGGDHQAADVALADLIAKDRDTATYQIAEVYAWRGETDKAFEWLEIAFDNHDTGLLALLRDPLIRSLRSDERYQRLLAKVGLPTAQ